MPDLAQSLGSYDLGYLQIVAKSWGIDYSARDMQLGLNILVSQLLDESRLKEMFASLPAEARTALGDLLDHDGRITWSLFTRRYGEVREMGPGRRDRERPDLDPVSAAEILFYRAIVGRAFFETPDGGEEYAYIPDDLRVILPGYQPSARAPLGRAAIPDERAYQSPATDRILDDTCTVLAARRMGLPEEQIPLTVYPGNYQPSVKILISLLQAASLLDESGEPIPEAAREFLEAERGQAMSQLAGGWLQSNQLNELAQLPHLVLEGEWRRDPLRTRRAILELLASIPADKWWGFESFINVVREQNPDFQRPAGDYDSWIIRQAGSERYLRGFESWDQVDGQLLRFLITGYLHWLGILDLAAPDEERQVSAFRFSGWSAALLEGAAPKGIPADEKMVIVRSDGLLVVSRRVMRSVRYQVARFCEWEQYKRGDYYYRLSPGSLKRAEENGLQLNHLLALLQKHAEHVPPNLETALERFEGHGKQARIEQVLVLRLSSPQILEELRASKAARFLGDPLGPTTVIVKAGAQEKVLAALVEMGYLGEMVGED
jgi:hypothetical protein